MEHRCSEFPRSTNYVPVLSTKKNSPKLISYVSNISRALTVTMLLFANDLVFIVVREYCVPFILREQLKASIREEHIKHFKQKNYDSTIENKKVREKEV